jgi:translation elongation factor aEF-1 beta
MSHNTGVIGVKIKIMPTSPEANLKKIEESAKKIVEEDKGHNMEYSIEPIAFGLKAIIAFFQWPEEKSLEELEEKFRQIENVNSIQIIDMRKIA